MLIVYHSFNIVHIIICEFRKNLVEIYLIYNYLMYLKFINICFIYGFFLLSKYIQSNL